MNKGVAITGVLLAIGAAFGVSKLAAKKHAAEKLTLTFKKFQIKSASFTEGILFKIYFSVVNPTPTKLSFTQPFVQIFIKDLQGNLTPIASSDNGSKELNVNGKENTEIFIEIRLPLIQALKIPSLLSYLVSNFLDKAAKKTKKIVVEYSTKAVGINISDKVEVLI